MDDLGKYILHPEIPMFGSYIRDDNEDPAEINGELTKPPNTNYERIANLGPLHFAYIPDIDSTAINHYLLTSRMPLLVFFLVTFSATIGFILHRKVPVFESWIVYLDGALMCLELLSFIGIIVEGPGYLPFYYPSPLPQSVDGDPTNLSGIVATDDQLKYAKAQKPPRNVKFFSSARRFVIRGDHFCAWSGCFIGKKNYKLFTLFNFYGLSFIVVTMLWIGSMLLKIVKNQDDAVFREMLILFILGCCVMAYAVFFLIFQGIMLVNCLVSICYNHTQVEMNKKAQAGIPIKSTGKRCDFCVYMFGPAKKWYTWLCPIGAYHGVEDYMLIDSEDSENEPFMPL